MNIHIGNLSPDTTEEDLLKLFSKFGKVKKVRIVKVPVSLDKGYGFIDISSPTSHMNQVEKLNGSNIKHITIGQALSKN